MRGLRRAPVEVTLVDRQNYTLFQPLVYQVAAGALAAAEIATPLRTTLRRQANARVVLAEVTGFDLARREIVLEHRPNASGEARLGYDTLIVAGGSRYSYFGHDEWQQHAPELEVARRRARHPHPHPLGLRGRRARARSRPAARLPDVRRGRRRADGCRDGGADRRARARRRAARLPRDRHGDGARPPGRVVRARPRALPALALPQGRASTGAARGDPARPTHGRRRGSRLGGDPRTGRRDRARRGAHGDLGCRRDGLGARGAARRRGRPRGRPRRSAHRRPRPDRARAPRGLRARRHGARAGGRWLDRRPCPGSRLSRCRKGATSRARSAGVCAIARRVRSATSTRATSRRSGGRRRSPT